MKVKMILVLVMLALMSSATMAQVKTKRFFSKMPEDHLPRHATKGNQLKVALPPEFHEYKKGNLEALAKIPEARFASSVDTDIDVLEQQSAGGDKFSTRSFSIKAEGALNISVQFGKFRLPEGVLLSIYTSQEITDSISQRENPESGVWATRVYQGDELFFSLLIPAGKEDEVSLAIDKVNAGFRSFGADFGNVGFSEACHVNVNCPAGDGWDPEKNSVALIVANGIEQCTGALVMNSCNFNTPFFLTAQHCTTVGNVPNWIFQFQTWSTDCATNVGWIETVQFNGCQVRAQNAATDFLLLELNTVPGATSGLHYAGWSRNTSGITSTTVIHHPAGDLMKISRDNHVPVQVTDITDMSRPVWEIDLDLGRLQGGSSGAPYFDQNHRIIGQHFRRPLSNLFPVCSLTVALGPRFDQSWTGGGTNATRLSNWLVPGGAGATTTNTTNVSALNPPVGVLTMSGSGEMCTNTGQYTLLSNGVAYTGNVTWTSSNTGAATISATGNPATLTKTGNGRTTITATVNGCNGPTSIQRNVDVNIPDVHAFNLEKSGSGVSCISYSNQQVSFGVSFNGYFGCSLKDMANVTEVDWQVISPNPVTVTYNSGTYTCLTTSYVNKAGFTISFPYPTTPYVITIRYRVKNSCGWSDWTPGFYHFVQRCGSFRMAPNPVISSVDIKLDEPDGSKPAVKSSIQNVEITDKTGTVLKRIKYPAGMTSARIDVSDLKPNTYYMRVFNGKQWETQVFIKL